MLQPQQRVKLKGALLPNLIVNGVADKAAELVADPSRRRTFVIVADVAVTTVTHEVDPDTGESLDVSVPTLRVRAIEEVTPDDEQLAARMIGRARDHRNARERDLALALFSRDGEARG